MKKRTNQEILDNAINLAKVGVTNLKDKRFDTARTFLECVKQELETKDGSLLDVEGAGIIYQEALDYLSGVCIKLDDIDDALHYLDLSFGVLKQLEEENKDSALLLIKYGSTFDKFGVINEKLQKSDEALASYQKSVALANRSLKLSASVEAYDLMALSYYRMAIMDKRNINKEMINSCISVWTQLKDMNHNENKYNMLINACEKVLNNQDIPALDTYEILNLNNN